MLMMFITVAPFATAHAFCEFLDGLRNLDFRGRCLLFERNIWAAYDYEGKNILMLLKSKKENLGVMTHLFREKI